MARKVDQASTETLHEGAAWKSRKVQAGRGAAKRAARTEAARRVQHGEHCQAQVGVCSTDSTVMSWAVARLSADRAGSWQEGERDQGHGKDASSQDEARPRASRSEVVERVGSWQEDERENGAGRPKNRSTGVRERRLSGKSAPKALQFLQPMKIITKLIWPQGKVFRRKV